MRAADVVTLRAGTHIGPPSETQLVRDRILRALLSRKNWRPERPWSWWELRQFVGGRCRTEVFRAAVEALLEEGTVIEVKELSRGRQTPRHLLVAAARWSQHSWGVLLEARGRPDVLQRLGIYL